MNDDPRYFRIGLFVLGGFLLLAAVLITFGAGKIFQPRMHFETYVSSSVSGIDAGSAVRFRGVPIGKVSNVTFVFNEYPDESRSGIYNYVVVVMEVTEAVFPDMFHLDDMGEQVERAVDHGLRARIEPQGITGLNYVELDFLNPREFPAMKVDWKPRHYFIPSAPGQLAGILDSVNKIMRDIEKLHLHEVELGIRTLLDNLNRSITEADIGKLSADIQKFATQTTALVDELNKVVDESDLPALSNSTKKSLDSVEAAVDEARRILANLEPSTRLNSDDINATLGNLRIISDNLRELSSELRANPSRLIFGSSPAKPSVFDGRRLDSDEPSPPEAADDAPPAPFINPGDGPQRPRTPRTVPRR